MIESGLADYVTLIPNQLIEKLENNSEVNVLLPYSWTNEFYLLNTKKPPTDNLWFRRAIASSLDRNTLSKYVYKNTGVDSKGLIPQNIPLFLEPDSLIEFDLDAARRYLKRSGLEPNSIDLDLSYVSTYEAYRSTAFMLLDNLKK